MHQIRTRRKRQQNKVCLKKTMTSRNSLLKVRQDTRAKLCRPLDTRCRIVDTHVEWGSRDEDHYDQQLWEDNWDDDNVEDDFSVQLR